MLYIKRYELIKLQDDLFVLRHKQETIVLHSNNWEDAEEETKAIIKRLREENKDKRVAITWG